MIHIVAFPLGIRFFRSSFPWNASIIAPNISTVNSRVLMFTCYVMFVHKICNKFCRITMIRLFCWPVGRGLDPSGTFAAAADHPGTHVCCLGKCITATSLLRRGQDPSLRLTRKCPLMGSLRSGHSRGSLCFLMPAFGERGHLAFTLCRIRSASQTGVPPSPGPRSGPAPTSA